MKKTNLFAVLAFIALATAMPIPIAIDVYPSSTYANFSIILNESGNASIAYGESTSLGNFSNDSGQTFAHSILVSGLAVDTNYYYAIKTCDSQNNCTTTLTSAFKTNFVQEVTPASSAGIELGLFAIILGLAIIISWMGLADSRAFLILVGSTLFFISGVFLFNGLTISFGMDTGEVRQVFFSDFYLKAIGVGFILISLYLYLRTIQVVIGIFKDRKERRENE